MSVGEMMVYELILLRPGSLKILVINISGKFCLPRLHVPHWTRPAEQLQKAIRATLGLHVIVLDFLVFEESGTVGVIAELLFPNTNPILREVALEDVPAATAGDDLEASILSGSESPLSQPGWIDEAVAWLESVTQRKLSSKSGIEQLNAGGAFSLVRFRMEDGSHYWLKATGEPNCHELSVTCLLSELCGDYLPQLIASRPAWNAWLMSGETAQVIEPPADPAQLLQWLEDAVESMAEVQMRTAGRHQELLKAGTFDQRIDVFLQRSEAVFDYLEEAMHVQISMKAPRLSKPCLRECRAIFEDVCRRTEDLGLPVTIVHGDLNPGNILSGSGHAKFIDGCEAYVGNPLIALQHLLRLNNIENRGLRMEINQALRRRYRDTWANAFDSVRFQRGFPYMPVLAIFSSLLGRGDWLTSPKRNDPRFQSYSRTLARHLDRALREPELMEVSCD